MFWRVVIRFILGCLCTLPLHDVISAAPLESSWHSWFLGQIDRDSDVIAAKETMNAAFSLAEGRAQPLYNPEIESEYEQEGDYENYRIGVNQTIDWSDKRRVREQQAGYSQEAARQAYELALQRKIFEGLQALVEWQASEQRANLAREQETQLDTLLEQVKERQQAGDLGQVDAEMAFSSLSQTLNSTAQALAQYMKAETHVRELLPEWSPERSQIPPTFWSGNTLSTEEAKQSGQWIEKHPAVVAAKAEWDVLQQSTELARFESKADPTVGINAGKTGGDDVAALFISMPLNVRNDYSAETRAAAQEALAAEARYQAIRRQQMFAIESSQAAMQEYQQRFDRWQSLMQDRSESISQLLQKQWRSGDLSTTEYLQALQQRAEGLGAGIDLRAQFYLARLDWLFQTGRLQTALAQLEE